MRYRAVIYSKTIIVEHDARTFHLAVTDAVSALEDAAQLCGWGQALIEEDDGTLVEFDMAPYPYD